MKILLYVLVFLFGATLGNVINVHEMNYWFLMFLFVSSIIVAQIDMMNNMTKAH